MRIFLAGGMACAACALVQCKQQGLRLPTVRELFDFCWARTAASSEGHLEKHRCDPSWVWSASVYSNHRDFAWLFNGDHGNVNFDPRRFAYGVRCVSGP
jgi:hypothetical protein